MAGKLVGLKYRGKTRDGRPVVYVTGVPARDVGKEELAGIDKGSIDNAVAALYEGKPVYEAVYDGEAPAGKGGGGRRSAAQRTRDNERARQRREAKKAQAAATEATEAAAE